MAKIIGDLCAPNGQYVDSEGNERTAWMKCGLVIETEKGLRVKLESIPANPVKNDGGGIWFCVFEQRPKDSKPEHTDTSKPAAAPAPAPKPAAQRTLDDDIPF